MTHVRAGALLSALALVTLLQGCKSAPSLQPGAGLTIVRELPAEDVIGADTVYFDEPTNATYAVVAGEHKGTDRTFERRDTTKFGASVKEELSGARIEYLRRDEAGNVVLTAVIDHANNALSLFEPPLVVMPAELPRGKPFEARTAMRVVDSRIQSKEKERGSAVRTVEYIGKRLLNTPIGEIECVQLRISFTADLRMADAETLTMLYVAPEYGVVAEQWSEVVKVFGALTSEKGEVIVLASEPK